MNAGLKGYGVHAIAARPDTPSVVFAGTGQGLFKSEDGGGLWTNTNLTTGTVYALAINAVNPDTIYASQGGSIYKSTDGGEHWSLFSPGLPDVLVTSLASDGRGVVFAGTLGRSVFATQDALTGFLPLISRQP